MNKLLQYACKEKLKICNINFLIWNPYIIKQICIKYDFSNLFLEQIYKCIKSRALVIIKIKTIIVVP